MAIIARGQITITDLNDGRAINLFIGSNHPLTQIYNEDNNTFVPNWGEEVLHLTPEVYVTGSIDNQVDKIQKPVWKINGSENVSLYGGTILNVSPYTLSINRNMESNQLLIECDVIYTDEATNAKSVSKSQITITKNLNAGHQIRAIAYAPNGTVFKNEQVSTLTARCDMWRGSIIDNTNVEYIWRQLINGDWIKITIENSKGITGFDTNTITIPSSAVLNFDSYRCDIKDIDVNSSTYNTTVSDIISFADMSDPYIVEPFSLNGNIMSSGLTNITLSVNVWRDGEVMPDSFFDPPSTGTNTCKWKKYLKDGTQDDTFGVEGIKSGRTINVTRDEILVSATFVCEIYK